MTPGVMEQLTQIYGIPANTLETRGVGDTWLMCGSCRNILKNVVSLKQPASTLPNLVVSLSLEPSPSGLPTSRTVRPTRRKKELLYLKYLTGRNRKYKNERPELANILGQIEKFCEEHDYNNVELGFLILHKFLSSASKFTMARQLKVLYNNKAQNISPRKSVANKFLAGRSHRAHRSLALFLKQQLGRNVFPSRKAEDQFVDALQPCSYSYKLYSLSEDPQCQNPFKHVQGLQRPPDPDVDGKSKEEAEAVRAVHRMQVKEYKKGLMTKTFDEKYLNQHCESPYPNSLVAIEDYDRLLAAHLIQLGPQILAKIKEINDGNCAKRIPAGRIKAKLLAIDGSDGFSDMHIISNKESRDYSDHGVTADFTVIRVCVEHELEEIRVEGGNDVVMVEEGEHEDGEELHDLSQAFSQSTIGDDSCITATQSSDATSIGGGEGGGDAEGDVELQVEDGYSLVFEEKSPNSSLASRPIFRGE